MTKRRINTNEVRTNTTVIYKAIPLFSISYRIECAGCHISSKLSSPTEAKLHSSYPSNAAIPSHIRIPRDILHCCLVASVNEQQLLRSVGIFILRLRRSHLIITFLPKAFLAQIPYVDTMVHTVGLQHARTERIPTQSRDGVQMTYQRMQGPSWIPLIPERNCVVLRRCGEQVPLHGVERYGVHFLRVRLKKERAVRLAKVVEEHVAIIATGSECIAVVWMPCNSL